MLLNNLGFALAGSPRNLSANLRDTTSGILDLDERLRLERRDDLEGIYDQRADEIEMGRTGNRSIAGLEAQILSDAAIRGRAGETDAFGARVDEAQIDQRADRAEELQALMAGATTDDPYEQYSRAETLIEQMINDIIVADESQKTGFDRINPFDESVIVDIARRMNPLDDYEKMTKAERMANAKEIQELTDYLETLRAQAVGYAR